MLAGAHMPENVPGMPFGRVAPAEQAQTLVVSDEGLVMLLEKRWAEAVAADGGHQGAGDLRVSVTWPEMHDVCATPVEAGACYRIDSSTVLRASPAPSMAMYRMPKRHDSVAFVHGSMRKKPVPHLCGRV